MSPAPGWRPWEAVAARRYQTNGQPYAPDFYCSQHHITIPVHKELTVGTLNAILTSVAVYVEMDCQDLVDEIFGK